ncbi:glycosyltransferase family 9 protein, partial [Haemophilus sp.]|uniref:glycosyltransferase family 9 protein n=1 Tax=Haemophilus sp. TaxID=740 RepID=UPI003AEFCC28
VLPKLTLTELAKQLANAKAVVSVDTGLAHLTAALDKPNITLYGATDPKLIGCYGKNQHYLTANSMENITSEQVFSVLNLLIK